MCLMKKFMNHINFTVGHSLFDILPSSLLEMIGERLEKPISEAVQYISYGNYKPI